MAETELEPLPKWSDDPNEYRKVWNRRKRRTDPVFARRQSVDARRWQKANPVRAGLIQYRNAARRRDLKWELSPDQFEALVVADCHYCGLAAPFPAINGVDRVDNKNGYTPDNVVTACGQCNYAKRDYTLEEFLSWATRLIRFQEDQDGSIRQA